MALYRVLALLFCISLFAIACERADVDQETSSVTGPYDLPTGFPPLEIPESNAFSKERWDLGKKIFYDKRLSADTSISCGTCHKPSFAFADTQATTPGILGRPGFRNVPSLANIAYHPYFLREGSVPTLEMQVLVPISEHNEFGFNMALLVERLSTDKEYQELSLQAYNRSLDAFVITRALANFERSLLSGNSRYDHYRNGRKDALSKQELEGMTLFFSSRTQCASCHAGFNFTNYEFANNGIYKDYTDEGRYRLTRKEVDKSLFKIPGLRNLGYTAPYMHDGSMKTIDDVLKHYNSGGQGHPNQSTLIKPLGLKANELDALKAFLFALDDASFINNAHFRE